MPKKPRKRRSAPRSRTRYLWLKLLGVALLLLTAFVIYSDVRVRGAFDTLDWQQPARVYARPLILAAGVDLREAELVDELRQLGYRQLPNAPVPGSYSHQPGRVDIHSREFAFAEGRRPARQFQVSFNGARVQRVNSTGGGLLEEAVLEPVVIGSVYPQRHEDRLLISLEQAPQLLIETLLLIEDQGFYQHRGISPRSIVRAAWVNLRAGRTVQGGSTLTQQLVKNRLLSRERSLWRKVQEAVMAVLVEVHYSKDRILETYLNEVYLGQEGSRAIHGFALAAHHYFNRPLQELSPDQLATLVGMIKGPSFYDPWRHPQRSQARRNVVLQEMAGHQLIAPEQLSDHQQRPLGLAKASAVAGVYPAYVDLVRRQLRRDYNNRDLQSQGLRIFTPFDPVQQGRAERVMQDVLSQLDQNHESLQGAMVVTAVGSGDVIAVVGGRQPRFAGFNRALDGVRPVGSLIKPAVYLTALMQPDKYTLASLVDDEPLSVANIDGSFWEPGNFDKRSHGPVTLLRALSQSYNQATARLGLELGVPQVRQTLRSLGVERPLLEVPALLLGAADLSPVEVATLYQTLAADGVRHSLRSIYAITDSEGRLIARYPQRPERTIDADAVHLIQYALVESVRSGTGRSVYQTLPEDFRVAGKTGTTNDYRDSWFAGFAGDYLAVVWVGRDDNRPTAGLTGSAGALRIWRQFMAVASREPLRLAQTDGIRYEWVSRQSGLLSRENCEQAALMPFIGGTAPQARDPACRATVGDFFRRLSR